MNIVTLMSNCIEFNCVSSEHFDLLLTATTTHVRIKSFPETDSSQRQADYHFDVLGSRLSLLTFTQT